MVMVCPVASRKMRVPGVVPRVESDVLICVACVMSRVTCDKMRDEEVLMRLRTSSRLTCRVTRTSDNTSGGRIKTRSAMYKSVSIKVMPLCNFLRIIGYPDGTNVGVVKLVPSAKISVIVMVEPDI